MVKYSIYGDEAAGISFKRYYQVLAGTKPVRSTFYLIDGKFVKQEKSKEN